MTPHRFFQEIREQKSLFEGRADGYRAMPLDDHYGVIIQLLDDPLGFGDRRSLLGNNRNLADGIFFLKAHGSKNLLAQGESQHHRRVHMDDNFGFGAGVNRQVHRRFAGSMLPLIQWSARAIDGYEISRGEKP